MKSLAIDSSSIISLATNSLLWILEPLKKQFQGDFYITDSVKQEVINRPLSTKRFKLEALMIKEIVEENIISLYESTELRQESLKLLAISNNIFKSKNEYIKILDLAEVECLALAIILNSDALVVDERTIRLLVEDPYKLSKLLKKKLKKDLLDGALWAVKLHGCSITDDEIDEILLHYK